jgi:signal transduction histidine kinase
MTEATSRTSEPSRSGDLDLLDSAAQTLEAIAGGLVGDDAKVRAVARAEAGRLRSRLTRDAAATGLDTLLAGLTAEFAEVGLVVEYSTTTDREVRQEVRDALRGVLAQALFDVVRRTEARTAVVRAAGTEDGVEVTVRDHGHRLESDRVRLRLGPSRALAVFLEGVGGTVSVWSELDRGTKVSLFVPV